MPAAALPFCERAANVIGFQLRRAAFAADASRLGRADGDGTLDDARTGSLVETDLVSRGVRAAAIASELFGRSRDALLGEVLGGLPGDAIRGEKS